MVHIYDRAGMARALTLDTVPTLLKRRIETLADDLIDYTEYLVIKAGDTEADIVRHVGFSPLINPIDGVRFPDPAFHPHWDWLQDHGGWFELIETFGSTFAYVLLIQDSEGLPPHLVTLCQRYAGEGA